MTLSLAIGGLFTHGILGHISNCKTSKPNGKNLACREACQVHHGRLLHGEMPPQRRVNAITENRLCNLEMLELDTICTKFFCGGNSERTTRAQVRLNVENVLEGYHGGGPHATGLESLKSSLPTHTQIHMYIYIYLHIIICITGRRPGLTLSLLAHVGLSDANSFACGVHP